MAPNGTFNCPRRLTRYKTVKTGAIRNIVRAAASAGVRHVQSWERTLLEKFLVVTEVPELFDHAANIASQCLIKANEFRVAVGNDGALRFQRKKKCTPAKKRFDVRAIPLWYLSDDLGQ